MNGATIAKLNLMFFYELSFENVSNRRPEF